VSMTLGLLLIRRVRGTCPFPSGAWLDAWANAKPKPGGPSLGGYSLPTVVGELRRKPETKGSDQ
jgi:hypothetical protein